MEAKVGVAAACHRVLGAIRRLNYSVEACNTYLPLSTCFPSPKAIFIIVSLGNVSGIVPT